MVDDLIQYVIQEGIKMSEEQGTVMEIEQFKIFNANAAYGSLYISREAFLKGQQVQLTEGMVKNLRGFDYLNIAHARYLLKLHFDTLEAMVLCNEFGEPMFDLPDGRGSMVGVFLQDVQTGCRSTISWFPIMGNAPKKIKPAEIDPDARSINDNVARAIVKAIAFITGIGFDLYSRLEEEDLIEAEEGATRTATKTEKKKARLIEPEAEDDDEDDNYDDEDDDDDEEDEEDEPTVKRRPSRFPSARTSSTRRK